MGDPVAWGTALAALGALVACVAYLLHNRRERELLEAMLALEERHDLERVAAALHGFGVAAATMAPALAKMGRALGRLQATPGLEALVRRAAIAERERTLEAARWERAGRDT